MYGNLEFSLPLFPLSFSIRVHEHKFALSIAFQTLMNVLAIHTTVARIMRIVQISWDHTTVLVILDLLGMDTFVKVRSYRACLILQMRFLVTVICSLKAPQQQSKVERQLIDINEISSGHYICFFTSKAIQTKTMFSFLYADKPAQILS